MKVLKTASLRRPPVENNFFEALNRGTLATTCNHVSNGNFKKSFSR